MNIVLLGAPGAGKGTQASRIVQRYGLAHISTGDILRRAVADGTALGVEARRYMDAGELVPDEVVIGLVKDRIAESDCAGGFILDGFPRTVPQADALDVALRSVQLHLDHVISIDVDRTALVERLTARRQCRGCGRIYNVLTDAPSVAGTCDACGGEVYQRDDDSVATVTNRLEVYDRNTAPLIDYYRDKGLLRSIDGDASVDDVSRRAAAVLEQ